MTRPVSEIIAAIEEFQPSNGNWRGLDALLEELFQSESASLGIAALIGVFERYPSEYGDGVFWSIVHGLESLPGYESRLIESVRKAPSEFALLMLRRLLNAGQAESGSVPLLPLFDEVAKNPDARPEIRQAARSFFDARKA